MKPMQQIELIAGQPGVNLAKAIIHIVSLTEHMVGVIEKEGDNALIPAKAAMESLNNETAIHVKNLVMPMFPDSIAATQFIMLCHAASVESDKEHRRMADALLALKEVANIFRSARTS